MVIVLLSSMLMLLSSLLHSSDLSLILFARADLKVPTLISFKILEMGHGRNPRYFLSCFKLHTFCWDLSNQLGPLP